MDQELASADKADVFLNSHGAWYEDMLLTLCIVDTEWFNEIKGLLCVEEIKKGRYSRLTPVNDFSDYKNYALFSAVRDYNEAMSYGESTKYPAPTVEIIRKFMMVHVDAGKLITVGEVELCLDKMRELTAMDTSTMVTMVRAFFKPWLTRRRLIHASREVDGVSAFGQRSNSALANLQLTVHKLDNFATRRVDVRQFHDFGDGINEKAVDVERFSTGMDKLDFRIGGGLARAEASLFIAGTGVGKTVGACQLAMALALQKLRGLLITTEQKHGALELRMISNYCRVPFNAIKNKFNEAALNLKQMERYREMQAAFKGRLIIKDWESGGESITANLDRTLNDFEDVHGALDFIILDWIGGGLGTVNVERPDMIRHMYQAAADHMVRVASKRNAITASFAQAHPSKAYNRLKIDADCISECKSMGVNMTNIIGITGFTNFSNKDQVDDFDKDQFTDAQFFYVSKARFGIPGPVKVLRNFGFQRFESVV